LNRSKECVAMLLSMPSFESFYGSVMHLTCEQYLSSYRNDFSFMYAYALAELGVDVFIYIPAWNCRGLHRIDERIFVRFLPLSPWYKLWRWFPQLSKTKYGRYVAGYANAKGFAKPLRAGLSEDEASILYIQEYWTARFDYLVKVAAIPIVGSDHGGKRRGQLVFAKKKSFQRALAITCQTEDECSEVRTFGREPVLLMNGVDTSFYSPGENVERRKTILIVARLTDRQKRVSDLIRAMQHLAELWTLEIAGTGPDEGFLRQLSETLGVSHRITFLGFIADKTAVRGLYQRCGVYCMPSENEGIPLAILEAMSCGCSVVVTRIRAFEGLVKHTETGFTVPVGDTKKLASAIEEAWNEREQMGAAARQFVVANNSLRAMAGKLQKIIQQGGSSCS
jgi:glycosyltransferase involved in cell wall biosynthesis